MIILQIFSLFVLANHTKKIVLTPGQSHFLVGVRQVAQQTSGNLVVEPSSSGVVVTALGPGYGILKSGNHTYEVHVLTSKMIKTEKALNQFCSNHDCQVDVHQGELILKGHLNTFYEFQKLSELCQKMDCQFRNQMSLDPTLADNLGDFLEKEYFDVFETRPHVRFKPYWEVLVSPADLQLAKTLLQPLGFQVRVGQNLLKTEPMVRLQVLFVELDRQQAAQFGLVWPQALSGQILPRGFWDPLRFGTFLDQNQGIGRVLAKPSLVIRNGAEGEFVAGGEIPIVVRGAFRMQNVSWKTYGIVLKARVQLDNQKRMIIKIHAEVSQLDVASSVENIPGIKKTFLNTEFNLKKPGIILLSGLIRHDQAELASGIPGLMDIPILGHLFKSDQFRNRRSDLFIFIDPEFVSP